MAWFNYFMEKEPCTKFCGVLISSHEVMKLQSFESTVSDAISANVQYILPLVSFTYICYFYEKNFFTQFMVFLTISHELMKLLSFE